MHCTRKVDRYALPAPAPRYDPFVSSEAFLSVRVTPRSSKDEFLGWQDGVLRIRLKAPPVDGRANEALCRYLSTLLGVAPADVELVSGATGRLKRLRVFGLTIDEVRGRLAPRGVA